MDTWVKERYDNRELKIFYSAEDLAQLVQDNVEQREYQRQQALAAARKTKEEVKNELIWEKEQELIALKAKIRLSPFYFNSEKELQRYNNFKLKHQNCWTQTKISAGRSFYVKPYSTGFSQGVYACCPWCGAEEDISDTEAW